jgi:Zn-dependent protease with chaperone function
VNINEFRHPKEFIYRLICIMIGGLIWAGLLFSTTFLPLLFLLPVALFSWVSQKFFQASIYGNSVHVNNNQYKEINELTQSLSQQLQLKQIPAIFVINSNGKVNALALKFLSSKYVILYSNLVDLLWCDHNQGKLRMVIAHELAHHAAGHVAFWTHLLMKPALFIPFLGSAYKRSCELTADRIAAKMVDNEADATAALITIASGSHRLIPQTSQEAFLNQERNVPRFFAFLRESMSSHPRMTRRIISIHKFYLSELKGREPAKPTKPVQTQSV